MSSRRSILFNYLRICFFANFVCFVLVVSFFFWQLHRRSSLESLVRRQFNHNVMVVSALCQANDILTNTYFRAASSFASNVLVNASAFCSSNVSSSVSAAGVSSSGVSSSDLLPDLSFHGFFLVDGIPYISIRNQRYKRGDFVLGYPIEDISPDVVKYRGKFYKVTEDRYEKRFSSVVDRN